MRNATHELVGAACAVAASRALELDALEAGAAALGAVWGSWLPDTLGTRLHRRGRLARRNPAVAALVAVVRVPLVAFALLARHRGVSHSLVACGLFAGFAALLAAIVGEAGAAAAAGCALAYCAHVLADACTPSGVSLWWPFSRRPAWLVPRPFRIRTGSLSDALLAVVAAMLAVALVAL